MPKYTIKRTYECHSLLQQGPCPDNQWFILRDDTAIAKIAIATCVDYPCQNTSYVPLVDTEKCQLIGDESPCQDGAVVVADYFGKGKCECQEGYLPYEDKCIKNGSQGPCQEQEIFTLTDDDQPLCELLDGARLALITLNKVCQEDERVGPKGDCIKINDAGLGTRSLGRSCLRCALNRLMNG